MPSGSKKSEYKPDQYEKQLAHARAWKQRNRERVRQYNSEYNRRRREQSESAQQQ